MITVTIDPSGRLRAQTRLNLPLSATAVWGQMRDITRFIALDPLHVNVRLRSVPGAASPVGAHLTIPHRFLGLGPTRIGRILRFREGQELVFSDLSRRGMRTGFPHICGYRVEPKGPAASTLTVFARGKWTATWVPRPAASLWIRWVLATTAAHIRVEFARYVRWRAIGHAQPESPAGLTSPNPQDPPPSPRARPCTTP